MLTVLSPENSVLVVLVKQLFVKLLTVVVKLLYVSDRHKSWKALASHFFFYFADL